MMTIKYQMEFVLIQGNVRLLREVTEVCRGEMTGSLGFALN